MLLRQNNGVILGLRGKVKHESPSHDYIKKIQIESQMWKEER